MECKNCGAPLEEEAALCPNCGAEQPREPEAAAVEMPAAEAASEPIEEQVAEAAPKAPGKKLFLKVVAAVLCVSLSLVLFLSLWYGVTGQWLLHKNDVLYKTNYTVADEQLLKAADKAVATVGDAQLTNAQLQVYYWMEVYGFLDENYTYLYSMGMDASKSLAEQYVSEGGMSYQQQFLEAALKNWHSYQSLALAGEARGWAEAEDLDARVEQMSKAMEESALYYGFENADAQIRADMGNATDMEDYLSYIRLYYKAADYFDVLYNEQTASPEEVETYFNAHSEEIAELYGVNKESGKLVDVRHILVTPKMFTVTEDGQQSYSEEGWELCLKDAEAILEQWKQGEATEESFGQLAMEKTEDPGSEATGGLYTFVYEGQMVEEFENWCFDESRQPGDTGIVKTPYGYHIMYYVTGDEGWYRCTELEVISAKCSEALESFRAQYPMDANFRAMVLSDVNPTG